MIARFEDYTGLYPYHCHVLEHEDNGMMAQYQVTDGQDTTPPPPPGDTTPDPGTGGGPSTTAPPPAPATADLGLRWLSRATKARSGARLTLRLQIRNRGGATSSPASVAVAVPRGWKGRRTIRIPALAPGAARTVKVHIRVAGRPHPKGTLVAHLLGTQPGAHADDRARLVYSRKAIRSAAAARFVCPLLAA